MSLQQGLRCATRVFHRSLLNKSCNNSVVLATVNLRGQSTEAAFKQVKLSTDEAYKYIKLETDENTGVSVLSLNRKPVNSLNMSMMLEMNSILDKLEADPKQNGLIITSALPKIFSAGLDIVEFYKPDQERLATFWRTLQEFFIKLYGSKMVTMAAINGNSPAGGCFISLLTDFRMMAEGNYRIGLNEVMVGIMAPVWLQYVFKNTVSNREAERSLQLGLLHKPEDALRIGLVDRIGPEANVVHLCQNEMEKHLKIPSYARQITKESLRRQGIENLLAIQDKDIEYFVDLISSDSVQSILGMYLQKGKKK